MTNPDITAAAFRLAALIDRPREVYALNFARAAGVSLEDIDAICDALMQSHRDGDHSHALIVVAERDAERQPVTLKLYPDGEAYAAQHYTR